MRQTLRVSVWPVGLAGYLRYERPVLNSSGQVVGWFTAWKPHRRFALDMAGFAVNTRLLVQHRSAEFSYNISRGEQESYFLSQLITLTDLEPKANNCTEVGWFRVLFVNDLNWCVALHGKPVVELLSATCHMLPHLTHVNVPRLNPNQTGRYSMYIPLGDGRLS